MGETELDESVFCLSYFSKGRFQPAWAERLGYRRRVWFLDRLHQQLELEAREMEKIEKELKKKK